MPEKREQLTRLIARIEAQPPNVVEALFRKHFGSVGRRFVEAMQKAFAKGFESRDDSAS